MKLSVSLAGNRREDVTVTFDGTATVGEVASAIVAADPRGSRVVPSEPLTFRLESGDQRVIDGSQALASSGVMAGHHVSVVRDSGTFVSPAAAMPQVASLVVVDGPDAGTSFPLRTGANQVGRGRDNDVRLSDPLVSKVHVRINIGEQLEIVDLGSANGVRLRGAYVSKAVLGAGDIVTVGETGFRVVVHGTLTGALPSATVLFNRSPSIDPAFEGATLDAPMPPQAPKPGRFPLVPMIAPILMGAVLFLITRNPTSVAFVALSPVMMIGSFVESRSSGRRSYAADTERFRTDLKDLEVQLHYAIEQEGIGRRREYPSSEAIVSSMAIRDPLLWCRRPDKRAYLHIRLGLGVRPARTSVNAPSTQDCPAELVRELKEVTGKYRRVPAVPLYTDLVVSGSLGIAAPRAMASSVARSSVMQLVGLHSPAELILCAVLAPEHAAEWDWLKWLPHVTSDHSPLGVPQIAVSSSAKLVAALEELAAARLEEKNSESGRPMPAIVVLVDDQAPIERGHLVQVMETAHLSSIHFVWMASTTTQLPAACRSFVAFDGPTSSWWVGDTRTDDTCPQVEVDVVDLASAERAARALAPVIDAGAVVEDDSGVPRRVSFLNLVDPEVSSMPQAVVDQWRASRSLPAEYPPSGSGARMKDNTLRAFVGGTADEPFVLDLRQHGPHALVGGTTGSGKSEFLQTWVLGMAVAHSPARVNFLFVDYKGGAAFAECINLPHCVGLVTDLSPYLVKRALVSLKAELKYREELLQRNGSAKDLLELEARDPGAAPPSLIIIVDEFAALAKEVPDFVDGVVDVAQRGRSLGLHLILATQRPAGVIRDNLRANTNLRVALRMADEDDSQDVVGSKASAFFDPSVPGRGIAKLGPGRLTTFQTGYAGGWTTDEPQPPAIVVEQLDVNGAERWEPVVVPVASVDPGPNDLKRVVRNVRSAADLVRIPSPRRPWQPELANAYELARIRPSRSDTELVFGVLDDPGNQHQIATSFFPDRDGNMAVYGTGGSGKSGFLRTLAVAAGTATDGPCHVYALDFGTRGLAMLEPLPHVGAVINGDDGERTDRLLRMLRVIADDRSQRFERAGSAGSISQYRKATGDANEPRILVLIDNFGALRQALETPQRQAAYESLLRLIADGRTLGIHFVMTTDRSITIPPAVLASVQRRLVLRMAQDSDYSSLGVPAGQLTAESPPGRGSMDGFEVQVAILGGESSSGRQAAALQRFADELAEARRWAPAVDVPRLPEQVRLDALPPTVGGLPTLGIADESLTPIGFDAGEPFLVIGPPQARPENVMLAMVQSMLRSRPGCRTTLVSLRRSGLTTAHEWDRVVCGAAEFRTWAVEVDESEPDARSLVVVDGLAEIASSDIDYEMQGVLKTLAQNDTILLALADSFQIGSAFGAAKFFKGFRNGLALMPEQSEGDGVFSTPFPRLPRSEFKENTGYLVRQGRILKVLAAMPV